MALTIRWGVCTISMWVVFAYRVLGIVLEPNLKLS